MSDRIIQPTVKEFQQAQRTIALYYKIPAFKLMRHLLDKHGYSYEEIAQVIGVTKQTIQQNYMRQMEDIT